MLAEVLRLKKVVETSFFPLSQAELIQKENSTSWSITECLIHLILSNEYYLVQIIEQLNETKKNKINTDYKPGIIGSFLSRKLRPDNSGKPRVKMKTFKSMDPVLGFKEEVSDPHSALKNYLDQLDLLCFQIKRCKEFDLKKNKIKTALGKGTYFELGNAIQFTVAHNERHIQQAKNIQLREKIGK